MIRKLFCSMIVMVVAVGFVLAEDFTCTITAVKDGKVTYFKMKKGDKKGELVKDGDAVTTTVDKECLIAGAKGFGKKTEAGDKIEDGLKNEMFTKDKLGEKGRLARITTEGEGDQAKVTKLLVYPAKKKDKDK